MSARQEESNRVAALPAERLLLPFSAGPFRMAMGLQAQSPLLTKAQMARLTPLLPNDTCGVPRVDDRRVISGIVHVLRLGGRWVDAPAGYGPHKTLYNRRFKPPFSRVLCRSRNAIERMFGRLKDFRRVATRHEKLATTSSPQSISPPLCATGYESEA